MANDANDWCDSVRRVAARLARDDYPAGSLAALRRLDPERPDEAAFWWLVADCAPVAFDDDRIARALAVVAQGMAIAHPFHLPAGGRRPLGVALAEAGVSEARLLRLLRSGQTELPEEVRRLARLMAAKGEAGRFDWSDVFDLVFWRGGDEIRRQIAKDYFRTLYKISKDEGEAA
jgi:CRISPR type I-E-associated protein CasB/Cse2